MISKLYFITILQFSLSTYGIEKQKKAVEVTLHHLNWLTKFIMIYISLSVNLSTSILISVFTPSLPLTESVTRVTSFFCSTVYSLEAP